MTTTAATTGAEEESISPLTLLVPAASVALVLAVTASGAGSKTIWYVIRAAGIVTYLLLTASMVAGVLVQKRALPAGRPRLDVFEIHSFLSLLVIGFGTFHAVTLLLDKFVGFSPVQILVPFTSDYRPLSVALGIITLYLVGLIYGSFWLKGFIGQKGWRTLHYGSYLAFALVTYHGILSGADTSAAWMIAIYVGAIAIVLASLCYRVMVEVSKPGTKPAAAR